MKLFRSFLLALTVASSLTTVPVSAFTVSFEARVHPPRRPFFHFLHSAYCTYDYCWYDRPYCSHVCVDPQAEASTMAFAFSLLSTFISAGLIFDACESNEQRFEKLAASLGCATVAAFSAWLGVQIAQS